MSNIPGNFTEGTIVIDDDAAHSATLQVFNGDFSLSGLVPDGRVADVYQARGATTGVRKGERSYPELSFTAQVGDFDHAFHQQAHGVLAAFVSTLADIGDYEANDLTFTGSYGAETREIIADDAVLTSWEYTQGAPSQVSLSFQVIGPLTINGRTYIPSR